MCLYNGLLFLTTIALDLSQVLAAFTAQYPCATLEPLLDAVRWTAMTPGEVNAALHLLQVQVQLYGRPTRLMSRLIQQVLQRGDTMAVMGQPRTAATRTLQLMAEVNSKGSLVAAKSAQQHIKWLGKVYLKAYPAIEGRPSCVEIKAADKKFTSNARAVFLAAAANGQHHEKLTSDCRPSWGHRSTDFLAEPLKQPLQYSQGGKKELLLACYVSEQQARRWSDMVGVL